MRTTRLTAALAAIMLSACGTLTPTREVTEGYAIFDVKAGADVSPAKLTHAVRASLQKNMSAVQITTGIPPAAVPEKIPRFQLVSPFGTGSGIAAVAAAQGQSLKVPVCEGAILTANARDTSMRRYGEGTSFFACLMTYRGGYALSVYTTFSKASGAFNSQVLAATLMRPLVGDSSQFINRAIADMVQALKGVGAEVALVEAYPEAAKP